MKRMLLLLLVLVTLIAPLTAQAGEFKPERATAYMDIRFECGCQRSGTGAMISRRGLLTAAHNLYCHTHAKPLKTCNFYFGATSKSKCFYQYKGKFQFTVYDTFKNGYNAQNDIGYVVFESNVGEKTGWFGTHVYSDAQINGGIFHIYSYNGNRKWQWSISDPYDVENRVVNNWLICLPVPIDGAAGGPVVSLPWDENDDSYGPVVGVYTSKDSSGRAYARRLTQDIFNDMKAAGVFN